MMEAEKRTYRVRRWPRLEKTFLVVKGSSGGDDYLKITNSEIGYDLFRISPLFRCNGLGPVHRPARRRHHS